ncbi:DUF6011 domain-containing protein [Paenarthrobacter nicotinovorans]|uniref:DUF6011 domain-containing protein n=1 Tax=Paenarthrobacter nicotinovorans TaxID=29320 RepID=UPI0035201153
MSAPPKRNRPVGQPDGLEKNSSTASIIPATPDVPVVRQHSTNPTDITIAILRRSAAEFGFSLSIRCTRCGSVLSATRSLSARLGPVCRKAASK